MAADLKSLHSDVNGHFMLGIIFHITTDLKSFNFRCKMGEMIDNIHINVKLPGMVSMYKPL